MDGAARRGDGSGSPRHEGGRGGWAHTARLRARNGGGSVAAALTLGAARRERRQGGDARGRGQRGRGTRECATLAPGPREAGARALRSARLLFLGGAARQGVAEAGLEATTHDCSDIVLLRQLDNVGDAQVRAHGRKSLSDLRRSRSRGRGRGAAGQNQRGCSWSLTAIVSGGRHAPSRRGRCGGLGAALGPSSP